MKWCYITVVTVFFFSSLMLMGGTSVSADGTFEDRGIVDGDPTPVGGIVPSGANEYKPDGYGSCEFVELVNNVMQFLIGLSVILAVIVFIYAGYLMVLSRGDVGQVQQAKGLFANVAIGVVLMLSAFLIINTILSIMLGGSEKALNWSSIECSYENKVGKPVTYSISLEDHNELIKLIDEGQWFSTGGAFTGGVSGGSIAVGGSCGVRTSGACSVENLRPFFGARAEEASQICNKESGGAPVKSGSDLCCGSQNPADCAGAPSFSGGYFQVNILAHSNKIPGCSAGFYDRNGSAGTQGNCIRRNGRSVCTGWSCKITNTTVYNRCMAGTMDRDTNFAIAKKLFNSSGFKPWAWSAKICNIPY